MVAAHTVAMIRASILMFALLCALPAAAQQLNDVAFREDSKAADYRAAWGEPIERSGNWVRYRMASGWEVHLMFSPLAPNRLVYAYLYGNIPGRRAETRLFSTREDIAGREVSQIDPCATEAGAVERIWGRPEYTVGQPVAERVYFMANGDMVKLGAPDAISGGVIADARTGKTKQALPTRGCHSHPPAPPAKLSSRPTSLVPDPFVAPRLLSDVTLSPTLTAEQVDALWGIPIPFGIAWHSYELASGETLSLLFSPVPPYGLVYADLIPAEEGKAGRRLFSNNVRAAQRLLDQVDACAATMRDRYMIWGAPDYTEGSGIVYDTYAMANGDEVTFTPPGIGRDSWITHPNGTIDPIKCPSR